MALVAKLKTHLQKRRTLRGPSELHFALADRISFLDGASWDSLTKDGSFFMQRDYLRMLEAVGPDNIDPRYALIFDDDKPVAAVIMQIAEIRGKHLQNEHADASRAKKKPLLARLSQPLAKQAVNSVHERVLVCGNLLTYGFHAVAFAEGADTTPVWHGVAEVLYRIRRAEKLAGQTNFIMMKDLSPAHIESSRDLLQLSYREVETEPNMVLALPRAWKSYDDYTASLASKYRSAVKQQVLKPIEAAGCTVEPLENIGSHAEILQTLYLQVHDNAAIRPFTLRAEYWPALMQLAGENARCSVIRRGDSILGFIITLKENADTAIAYHIGFDREQSASLPLYLRLLHATIGDAITLGCARLSFGRTALEPKAALGAQPEPMWLLVRHRQPLFNSLMRNLLGGIHHDDAPERNPFKKNAVV